LGLTYKPQTDVVEESQGLLLSRALAADKLRVVAYDPAGMKNARGFGTSVEFAKSVEECVQKSDLIVITIPWREFQFISPELLKKLTNGGRSLIAGDCSTQNSSRGGWSTSRWVLEGTSQCRKTQLREEAGTAD